MREYLYSLATDRRGGFIAGFLKILLFILSLIYGLAVRILSFIYQIRPYRLDCKVISIGNITLGGTGKTSLVEFISRHLRQQGHKVVILSRGYGGHKLKGFPDYRTMGDEPYMLSRNLVDIPVVVNKDRIRGSKEAIHDFQTDTAILDDGFQQWRIKKDLEIVTVDATNPFGNLRLLPRGILREPISSLKRADIFVLTKVNLNPDNQNIKSILNRINPEALIVEAAYKPEGFYKLGESRDALMDPEGFRGRQVCLVCGIADPQSFERLISNLGIDICLSFRFPDHYLYTQQDISRVIGESKQKGVNTIITSEKDAVRLSGLSHKPADVDCLVLRIRLELFQNEIFIKRIHSLY